MVSVVKRALYPAVSTFWAHATLVEGLQKGAAQPFRCLFVDNSGFSEYLTRRMFAQPPAVLRKWRIWIPALRKLIRERRVESDLCVAVLPKIYESVFTRLYDYRTTAAVRQVIDTSGSWDDVRSRFSTKKRQISNGFEDKYGLGYRMSTEPGEFDHFYHRMFVPHITRRFGGLSMIDRYEDMKQFFLKGVLLFVTKNGAAVAGALSLVDDGILRFRRSGVLDGDESHVECGAQTALYYFQLRYAHEHNLRAVDTMLSAPFLNDGVHRHKREWGAAVLPNDEARTWVYVCNAAPSEKVARFFENNPAVICCDSGLKGLIGVSGAGDVAAASMKQAVHRYESRGLGGFVVLTRAGVANA